MGETATSQSHIGGELMLPVAKLREIPIIFQVLLKFCKAIVAVNSSICRISWSSADCITARNPDSISSVGQISDPGTSWWMLPSPVEEFLNKMSQMAESGQFISK